MRGDSLDFLDENGLRDLIKAKVKGSSRKAIALELGISYTHLVNIINGWSVPGIKAARKMGWKPVRAYIKT